jgi:hypothetical protein
MFLSFVSQASGPTEVSRGVRFSESSERHTDRAVLLGIRILQKILIKHRCPHIGGTHDVAADPRWPRPRARYFTRPTAADLKVQWIAKLFAPVTPASEEMATKISDFRWTQPVIAALAVA